MPLPTTPLAIPPVPTIEDDEEDVAHQDGAIKDFAGITELVKIEPERVDGVETPANGFPILLLKSIGHDSTGGAAMADAVTQTEPGTEGMAASGETVDGGTAKNSRESPGGAQGQAEDGTAPTKEALEKAAASYQQALRGHREAEPTVKDAVDPTDVLKARAAWDKWNRAGREEGLDGSPEGRDRWIAKAMAAPAPPPPSAAATGVGAGMKSDDDDDDDDGREMDDDAKKAEAGVYKRDIDTATRRRLAGEGKALGDGSYPIENKEDLHNAAILARSGHGNVSGAKRLIARRASELGVSNPLDSSAKKTDASGGTPKGMAKCPTCSGAGKIRDGSMTCPKCKGKGSLKPGKARKAALAATVETLEKTVAAGLITRAAADRLIAEARAATGVEKDGPLPSDTHPVGAHREPDGTSTVEPFEHDAGLPTDRDPAKDHVPASVSALTMKDVPYVALRMHDALCAAFAVKDVFSAYPSLEKVTDAVSPQWFAEQAQARLAAGKTRKGAGLANLAAAAETLLAMDADAVTDARALMAKAVTAGYPDVHIKPSDPRQPSAFHRGYLSAGHAREHATGGSGAIPPSTRVPEPQDYQRGYLTAGHAAPSPADHSPNMPVGAGHSGHEYYTTAEQQMAADAMRSLHDHIASTFAGACPMAPTKAPMPLSLGADNTPSTKKPPANMGGISTVKSATAGRDSASPRKMKGGKMRQKKTGKTRQAGITAAVKAALQDHQPAPAVTQEDFATLLDARMAEVTGRYETQIATLQKQVDELGAQPDPAMAPVRGQMARAPQGDQPAAVPVEKRSLIDESRERQAAQRARYAAYLAKQAESPDPKVRHQAEAVIERMEASNAA